MKKNLFFLKISCWFLLSFSVFAQQKSIDGDWQLTIDGTDRLEFGSEFVASGVELTWSTKLLFTIKNGQFLRGTGLSELNKEITSFSRPDDRFQCVKKEGSYVSKNGQIFNTPHLRYVRFPISGQVPLKQGDHQTIKLVHGMDYPGNYYGLLYECFTRHPSGKNWLIQSPRVSKEKGSRQSIDVKEKDGEYRVNIKQVKAISPGPTLEIPLIDQWQFLQTDSFAETELNYRLTKLKKE